MSVPGLELHHGLVAARGGGGFLLGIWRVFRFKPAIAAAILWALFACSSMWSLAATRPDTFVETRSACDPAHPMRCALCPTGDALAEGAYVPPGCEGGGTLMKTTPVSFKRPRGAANQAASLFQTLATFATIGAITVFIVGGAGAMRARRPSRVMAAARHVKRETDRARRDVDRAQRTATKLGGRRLEKAGKRWAAEDAQGLPRSELSRLDRALIGKRVAPPKQKKAKGKRKADKAAASEVDWDTQAALLTAEIAARNNAGKARLVPTAGPPVAPNASPSPQIAAHRARTAAVSADVAQFLGDLERHDHEANGWVGYTPPPAPVPLGKENDR